MYLSESWAIPAFRLWVGGALGMIQDVPFPASGRVTTYNSSLFNETAWLAEDFELRNILSDYNEREGMQVVALIACDTVTHTHARENIRAHTHSTTCTYTHAHAHHTTCTTYTQRHAHSHTCAYTISW